MEVITWGAVAGFVSALVAISGWQWRLASRLTKADSAAEVARISAAAAQLRVEMLASEFNEFRVHVASEYANREAFHLLEQRLIDAINRLGDRMDKVFSRAT